MGAHTVKPQTISIFTIQKLSTNINPKQEKLLPKTNIKKSFEIDKYFQTKQLILSSLTPNSTSFQNQIIYQNLAQLILTIDIVNNFDFRKETIIMSIFKSMISITNDTYYFTHKNTKIISHGWENYFLNIITNDLSKINNSIIQSNIIINKLNDLKLIINDITHIISLTDKTAKNILLKYIDESIRLLKKNNLFITKKIEIPNP
jgi:hypothetical protein